MAAPGPRPQRAGAAGADLCRGRGGAVEPELKREARAPRGYRRAGRVARHARHVDFVLGPAAFGAGRQPRRPLCQHRLELDGLGSRPSAEAGAVAGQQGGGPEGQVAGRSVGQEQVAGRGRQQSALLLRRHFAGEEATVRDVIRFPWLPMCFGRVHRQVALRSASARRWPLNVVCVGASLATVRLDRVALASGLADYVL